MDAWLPTSGQPLPLAPPIPAAPSLTPLALRSHGVGVLCLWPKQEPPSQSLQLGSGRDVWVSAGVREKALCPSLFQQKARVWVGEKVRRKDNK